ncbi:MAG: 4-hydroxy-tetrahydrodipicolinate reductase [Deltaproteobacteria bacterium]|nr:4-hydroxy-tetrahydrodipicolinate reductase [Deltaproteobacteria bacterium]
MANVAVTGAAGRMGNAVIAAVRDTAQLRLVFALEKSGHTSIGRDAGEVALLGAALDVRITDDIEAAIKGSDVMIDFSVPQVSMECIEQAAKEGKAIVIGTTGFSYRQRDRIRELSAKTRVVMAPNMSVGVNLLFKLVHEAAKALSEGYDIEIVESHHRFKKDAPSGTALRIAEVAAEAVGRDLEKVAVYERRGIVGERRPEEIGIQTIRAGDIVGDHTIIFAAPGERVELTHKAQSRETFARGAARAACWVLDKPSGFYDMQDVLGLK